MVCCRCNRTGTCSNCSCCKSDVNCTNCLPGRLGRCTNTNHVERVQDLTPNSLQNEYHIENSRTEQETESAQPSRREPNTNFNWGTLSSQDFCKIINECYEEIVHWKRNLFLIPSGGAGKSFVTELARLFQAYADGSAMEDIALKACMVMQVMLLQRPHKNSRSRDHVSALSRRLNMWLNGEIATLLQEGRCLQARISSAPVQISEDKLVSPQIHYNLISVGKIREAL